MDQSFARIFEYILVYHTLNGRDYLKKIAEKKHLVHMVAINYSMRNTRNKVAK